MPNLKTKIEDILAEMFVDDITEEQALKRILSAFREMVPKEMKWGNTMVKEDANYLFTDCHDEMDGHNACRAEVLRGIDNE
jgi:hypothetical protein